MSIQKAFKESCHVNRAVEQWMKDVSFHTGTKPLSFSWSKIAVTLVTYEFLFNYCSFWSAFLQLISESTADRRLRYGLKKKKTGKTIFSIKKCINPLSV